MEYAFGMFSYDSVDYILLNVYQQAYTGANEMIIIDDSAQTESKMGLQGEFEYLRDKFPDGALYLEQRSEFGGLGDVIKQITEAEDIDYIVMGSKGASGLGKLLVGSNTADVVQKIKCPIIVVPNGTDYSPPGRIAFATDREEIEPSSILDPMIAMAERYQSELYIVNILPELSLAGDNPALDKIDFHPNIENIPHRFYSVGNKSVITGLDEFVHEHEVDLLAMVAREHSFLDRLFRSSVTKQMSMICDLPLLILHES